MLVRPIDALLPRLGQQFGTKATRLAALVRAGFPVPAAYAIARDAFDAAVAGLLPQQVSLASLAIDKDQAGELCRIRERILEQELAAPLARDLARALASLKSAAVESVAVRASSTAEPEGTPPSLHVAVLNVRDELELSRAVRRLWASMLTPEVLVSSVCGSQQAPSMGIVVQAMVPADASALLYTENPLTGDSEEMVVHAQLGLGAAALAAVPAPGLAAWRKRMQAGSDAFRLDKQTGFVRDRVIAIKHTRVVAGAPSHVREEPVPTHLSQVQALDEHVLSQLTLLGRRVEEQFGEPCGVQVAVAGDTVYVLGCRPLSALPASERRERRQRSRARHDPTTTVWSNLDVGEALPGVATPLTWSLLSGFSERGFREAFAALGCKVPKGLRLVGNFRGRIYLSLTDLARVASQVPGLRPSQLVPLSGDQSEIERLEGQLVDGHMASRVLGLPSVAARFARTHLGFERELQRIHRTFAEERSRIERLDLRILPGAALGETLADAQGLFTETCSLLLHAYGGLVAALVPLRAMLGRLREHDTEAVVHSLLSTRQDAESAGPGLALFCTAEAFASDEPARARLLAGSVETLDQLPLGAARSAIEELLVQHGHRAAREAELSEPRFRERPRLLLDALRMQLAHAESDPQGALSRRLGRAKERSGELLARLPAPVRPIVRGLLNVVRRSIRRREQLRSQLAHVLYMLRAIALDASRRMAVREPELGADAAFMLTLPELHAFLRGDLRRVGALCGLRREQYERDRALPDPPDTFVGYPPPIAVEHDSVRTLSGLGMSGGAVEGRVRVLREPDATLEPGEILVVTAADVGWTPLFVVAGGLVSELGGSLSHGGAVAREYGLPTVVSVRSATRALRTGDRVRLDGAKGTVEVLAR